MARSVLAVGICAATLASARADTAALAKQVAKQRGLPLKKPIEEELVDRAELRARILRLASEDKTQTEVRAEGFALARWGLVPLGLDYLSLIVDLLGDQIAGYYDPKTRKLTLATDEAAGRAETVLVHEIEHALADQSFDLEKYEDVPVGEGDAGLARRAVVEGDGVALMIEMLLAKRKMSAPWVDPTIALELGRAMALPTGDSLDRAPLAVREVMLFPYRAGLAFVASIRRTKPWSAVDAAFKHPPRSTEQVLHADKYAADEPPVTVTIALPVPDFSIVHSTVWGELGFGLFLRAHGVESDVAELAATGWGGDRVVVLARESETHPERAIGFGRFEWDTEADAMEAQDAAVRAIDETMLGATVEHGELRTRWLGLDARVAFVERRGSSIVIAVGVPLALADTVATQAWTASKAQANK